MTRATAPRRSLAAVTAALAGLMLFIPTVANAAPPSNDNFASRTPISSTPFSNTQQTSEATKETGEPQSACGFDKVDKTVWYEITPAVSGPLQVDTIGSSFDSVIAVFTGSALTSLDEIACNDDASSAQSAAVLDATAGTSYAIQVGGFEGKSGSLKLNVGPPSAGSISGTVRSDAAGSLRRACVDVFDADAATARLTTQTTASGTYTAASLPTGTYQLRFYDCDGTFDHLSEWFDDKTSQAAADEIAVASPASTGSVNATLTAIRLSVTKTGPGTGTVTSTPAGIDCGTDCSEIYTHGTSVTLSATSDAGSAFNGWTGCASTNGTSCTVSMTGARAVAAAFKLQQKSLTVTKSGPGAGTVTGPGIDCGSDCVETYEDGTAVTLSATPGVDSAFDSWTGCDTQSGNQCSLTMSAAKSVTAVFKAASRHLTVTKTGSGTGTVTSTPAGINCGDDCEEDFNHGTSVTLSAAPASNSSFVSWAGCTSTSGSSCTVSMIAAKAVTVRFDADTTAPDTTISSGPAAFTKLQTATFSFTSTESGSTFECSLDSAPFTACTSPATYGSLLPLSEGDHTFAVRATDRAGNTDLSPAEWTWTIDLTAPETSITGGPSGMSNNAATTFTFESTEPGAFVCKIDTNAFAACVSPKSYFLTAGSHTFQVQATDRAGNVDGSPASRTWTIDLTKPDTTITAGPSGATSSPQATFSFTSTESPSTFECSLDNGTFTSCKAPKTYVDLLEGSHTFRVRAVDEAGNVDPSPATQTWVIDTTSPDTTITGGPTGIVSINQADFTFQASEQASFFCSLDNANFTDCTSPKSYTALTEGTHSFRVRATDAAGNVDSSAAERTWTIDITGPGLTVNSPAGGAYVNDTAVPGFGPASLVVGFVTVRVTAVDLQSGVSSFQFEVDGTAVPASEVTVKGDVYSFTYRPATPGQHTITSKATNGSGISSSMSIQVVGIPAG